MSLTSATWMHHRLVQWRTAVLVGAVIACCLSLNLVVLGLTPRTAAPTAQAAAVGVVPPAVTDPQVQTSTVPPAIGSDRLDATLVAQSQEPVPAGTAVLPLAVVEVAAPTQADPETTRASTAPAPTSVPTTASPTVGLPTPPLPATTAPATAPPTTTAPTTTPPTTTAPTTAPPTTTALIVEYPQYVVNNVGHVVLTYTNGSAIELYGVYAGTGWVYDVEQNGPEKVKIKFFNIQTENEAEWTAKIENGRIKVEG